MLLDIPSTPTFRCPGESYDIPRAVHLARLAAGYQTCRDCPHRDLHAGPGARDGVPSTATADGIPARSLFTIEGVRGVYLNELTRGEAGRIAGAFASCLWDDVGCVERSADAPRMERRADGASALSLDAPYVDYANGVTVLATGRSGPTVVLARDERPAAPDLVMGVGLALSRMGCHVVDIGPATRPAFWFAVRHLNAAGGVHVTGARCDPAWIGMDFVREEAHPCSRGGELDLIEARYREGFNRPTRRSGSQRLLSMTRHYETELRKHFHALRPLRIALGCPNRLLRELLARLFLDLECRLVPVEVPLRARNSADPHDPDVQNVSRAVRENAAHLGLLIDDDAQSCALFDETGAPLSAGAMLRLFADVESGGRTDGVIAFESNGPVLNLSLAAMSSAMQQPGVICGGGESGRYWFVDRVPTCDAVVTLVKLLHVLSRSDAAFSTLLQRHHNFASSMR